MAINIELIDKKAEEMKLRIKGSDPAFMVMLRRIILSEIPTMAIEWVDFIKNSSALPDEIIANRLGQIPLTFTPGFYKMPEECNNDIDHADKYPQCFVKLYLSKKGPCMVYSGDLQSNAPDVKPVYDKIPIVQLLEGQELEFEAIAHLGIGKEHSKWQAGILSYRMGAKIKIGNLTNDEKKKLVELCPKKVFSLENGKLKIDEKKCNLCNYCVEVLGKEKVNVEPREDEFFVEIETVSGLPVEELLPQALNVLKEKLIKLKESLKSL